MYTHRTPSSSSSPPASPYYATNQNTATPPPPRSSKADQIVQNFYTKVAQIVTQSRLLQYDSHPAGRVPQNTLLSSRQPLQNTKKANKWFNLELDDSDIFKEDIKPWRQAAITSAAPPKPMVIEFYLDISDLAKNQILVLTDENSRRHKVDFQHILGTSNTPQNIMLESWQLTLSHPLPDPPPDLPILYKKSITFFRSLYAYVRLLPAYRLFKRLRKVKLSTSMKIGHRFVLPTGSINADIGLDTPVIDGVAVSTASSFTFGSIDTPFGTFTLSVDFRTNCDFHIDDDSEVLLSVRLLDMDENFFTPTMARYSQEEERQRQQEMEGKEGRRRSYPVSLYQQQPLQATPPNFLSTSASPHTLSPLSSATPSIRSRASPNQNTENEIIPSFPRSSSSSSSSLSTRYIDQARNLQGPNTLTSNISPSRSGRESLQPSLSPASTNRPNVTLVSPFKSPSLSSSPTYNLDSLQSPIFIDRASSSPMHRSPSSVSLQQRYNYASSPNSARPLPIGSGNALSSSIRSTSSSGSPTTFPAKFSSSFSHRYERSSGDSGRHYGGRDRDWNIGSRRLSRGSQLTNRSDDTTSDRGSYNSSFFASLDDDVSEFVKMVDSREPLKAHDAGVPKPDESDGPSSKTMMGSVYRSKVALSKLQQLKDFHNHLTDSMSISAETTIPQNLASNGALGASPNSSVSSSSINFQPNVPSRLNENMTTEKPIGTDRSTFPQPVTIPRRGMSETRDHLRHRRSSSLTYVESGTRIPAGMAIPSENNIIGIYSSYPEESGMDELRRAGSNSSLTSLHRQYHYHPQHQQRALRGDSSPGSEESILKRHGSGNDTQSSIGSPSVGSHAALGGLGIAKHYTNRRDSSGSGRSPLNNNRKPISMDDDDLLFAMSEITSDERTSGGGVGSSSSPSSKDSAAVVDDSHRSKVGVDEIGFGTTIVGVSDVIGVGVIGIPMSSGESLAREQQDQGGNGQISGV